MKAIRARPGRSFALLVGAGVGLELGGAGAACLGIGTVARCEWAFPPGGAGPRFPSACTTPIAGVGFHFFVPAVILVGLLGATVLVAGLHAVALGRSARRADMILGPPLPRLPDDLVGAATRAGAQRVELREDDAPYALCIGALHPRVAVSTGLLAHLSRDEVAAVLAHEELHRRRLAPLRQQVARVITRALFFLPLLGDLLEIHLVEEEILADRRSTAIAGRRALARALGKLAGAASVATMASGFGRVSALPYRVRALQEGTMPLPPLRLRSVLASAVSLGALVVLVTWMPLAGLR